MGLPPTPLPPIRLQPAARCASALPAGVASLIAHGALLALGFAGSGHWRAAQPPYAVLETNVLAFTYVALAPPARSAEDGSARSARSEHRLLSRPLPRLEPAELIPTTMTDLPLRIPPPRLAPRSMAPTRGAGGPDAAAIVSSGEGFVLDRTEVRRGATRTAELLAKAGDACPVLRRPPRLDRRHGALAVAVIFVVDTFGAVDRATLRVVQRPGEPPEGTGFIPHIYTVGASVRMDRSLPGSAGAYGAIAAGDVARHVGTLRFRPALRNGRPVRSSVLVACQAD